MGPAIADYNKWLILLPVIQISGGGCTSSFRLFLSDRRKIFDDLHSPKRLAVDWISKNIYWTDDEADVIEMSDFEGKFRYKVNLLRNWLQGAIQKIRDTPGGGGVNKVLFELFLIFKLWL